MSVWAVVVGAGEGRRFGRPKQLALLGGRRVIEWSVEAARSVAEGVVVVVPAAAPFPELLPGGGADACVAGAPTRAGSVRAGLAAVPASATVVVVHDAARPLATPALFRVVVEAVAGGADGAVPGLPVAETVKRVDGGRVLATVDRDGLVAVQTPQAFRAEALRAAHASEPEATDDARLVEALGGTVVVVPGERRNLKLTVPEDLAVASALLGC
jgi:2-C-methyl-D-erythritol 4-phosphate cytidylyltransferase